MRLLERRTALNQIIDGLLADPLVVSVPLEAVLRVQESSDSCAPTLGSTFDMAGSNVCLLV